MVEQVASGAHRARTDGASTLYDGVTPSVTICRLAFTATPPRYRSNRWKIGRSRRSAAR